MATEPEWLNKSLVVLAEGNRSRYDRRGQKYPCDIINDEWKVLEPMLPIPLGRGRPRKRSLREVINGIPWDAMPKDLPPWSIGYDYWLVLTDGGQLDQINHLLVMTDREKSGFTLQIDSDFM